MSDGVSNQCSERGDPFLEQNVNGASRNTCSGRGTGKRFARRAKRWAELQQRRYNQRLFAARSGFLDSPEESCMFDDLDLSSSAVELLKHRETPHAEHLCNSISHWIPQPYWRDGVEHCSVTSFEASFFMSAASIEYATRASFSVCRVASESPHSQTSIGRSSHQETGKTSKSLTPSSDLGDLLSLVETELSFTSKRTSKHASTEVLESSADTNTLSLHLFLQPGIAKRSDFSVNTAPPPEREWVMIRHADPDRPIATFTVLCYNVLCDKYATVNQYSYCPSWALNWEYRKMSIMKEIRNYEADIITLQEVETEQFRLLFQPELKVLGYTGIFSPKSRAKTMNEEDRKYVDGCAIFWKSEKFEIEREHLIEFTQIVVKKAASSEHMLNRVMPRDNIALCAVLRIKENVYNNRRMTMAAADNVVGSPLVVCTAHIHWDPESLRRQAGVFEFLSRGQLSRTHSELKGFRDDSCLEMFSSGVRDPNCFTHSLRLDSAVELSNIPFTNYTLDFKGMIDYIFSTPQSLARLGFLGAFDSNWVAQNKIIGFPHPHVPSDHIPIMAQYAVIPTSHQRAPPPPHPLNNFTR
ncbi:endonuclease/exonuclease/phosphatase family protein [Ostertagia ostertagi]